MLRRAVLIAVGAAAGLVLGIGGTPAGAGSAAPTTVDVASPVTPAAGAASPASCT